VAKGLETGGNGGVAPIIPVIISGGAGSRLWPLSRGSRPKQFLDLTGDATGGLSLLAATLLRTADTTEHPKPDMAAPIIVANADHRFLVAEACRAAAVDPMAILLEPVGRNTAPAIAAAALVALDRTPEALILVQSSDHLIRKPDAYLAAVRAARAGAEAGYLMTFGVTPDRPETGYGWIESGAAIEAAPGCHAVAKFHEKPDLATAERFLASGTHAWNAGIFLMRARDLLAELDRLEPALTAAVRAAVTGGVSDIDFIRLAEDSFSKATNISIDNAVMERSDHVGVVPVDMDWTDVGGFDALYGLGEPDANGNVALGNVVAVDTKGCHIRSESGRLIALVDVEDLTVIETDDAIMIAPRGKGEGVKRLVEEMKRQERPEVANASRVYRPWGWYQTVDLGDRFQVKRIRVEPGASLSLQMHHHRAEHWVVVSGTAKVSVDGKDMLLGENESTYIPLGATHRLENPGRVPLEMIEVQSGAYLGEDDIVRFSDAYGRE
jgi:mannose-1-phosphate guanylyltransferase/mannose-6-phosphate isomerase